MEESDPVPLKPPTVIAKEPAKGKKPKEVIPVRRQYVEEQVSEEEATPASAKPVTPVVTAAKKSGKVADEEESIIPSARLVHKPT